MEKEFNQNTRTLIVCFVFALMFLIPLRFVELNNNYYSRSVLGESTETVYVDKCLSDKYVDSVVSDLLNQMDFETADIFESHRCK